MHMLSVVLFSLGFSLLLVHEMDAVRRAEWRMFIVLRDMPDDTAHRVFTALHIPLYAVLLWLLLAGYRTAAYWIVDIFLLAHALLHVLFERHPKNGLKGAFSRILIYSAAVLAAGHLATMGWWG